MIHGRYTKDAIQRRREWRRVLRELPASRLREMSAKVDIAQAFGVLRCGANERLERLHQRPRALALQLHGRIALARRCTGRSEAVATAGLTAMPVACTVERSTE